MRCGDSLCRAAYTSSVTSSRRTCGAIIRLLLRRIAFFHRSHPTVATGTTCTILDLVSLRLRDTSHCTSGLSGRSLRRNLFLLYKHENKSWWNGGASHRIVYVTLCSVWKHSTSCLPAFIQPNCRSSGAAPLVSVPQPHLLAPHAPHTALLNGRTVECSAVLNCAVRFKAAHRLAAHLFGGAVRAQ